MQSAKRKVQNVGAALQFVENICHSEEHSDEESLLVLLFTLVEILRYAQNDTIKQLDKLKFINENKKSLGYPRDLILYLINKQVLDLQSSVM